MWCIPGSALNSGTGWKFWYSQLGTSDFVPAQPKVFRCANVHTGNPSKVSDQVCPAILNGQCLAPINGINRRIFIGELKLESPIDGGYYWIEMPEVEKPFILQIPPKSLPKEGLNFILSSCFWRNDDKTGHYARGIHNIMSKVRPRPSFKLLTGDQIYLDYPLILRNTRQHIKNRYLEYWGDSYYRDALGACANYFTCDDHEYWNNFPEFQAHLPYTYTESNQSDFTHTAEECYKQFQGQLNPNNKPWYSFDIDPVSFFTIDTRSHRSLKQSDKPCFMDNEQWTALEEWQKQLKGPGILTVGQPIFQKDGNWKDYSLSNFEDDYGRLLHIIKQSFDGQNDDGKRHDIVILSGDIHHGRHASGWLGAGQELHEFVSSPASRVGPFVFSAKTEQLPGVIQTYYKQDDIKVSYITEISNESLNLANQIAVVNLTPLNDRRVEIDFSIYQVRPLTQPSWNVVQWKNKFGNTTSPFQKSYSSSLVRKIILQ